MTMKRFFLLPLCLLCMSHIQAQIGINTDTPKATLDIKVQTTGVTTAEGLIAPQLTRSQLVGKDARYGTDQKGAIIYVSTIDGTTTTKTTKVTIAGYYYFDGSIWQPMDYTPESLYLPSFNLPMTAVGTAKTYDLYTNVYKKQFTKTGNSTWVSSNASLTQIPEVYTASQLDFVVTYYDPSVIKVNSVSATGVLNYDVLSIDPNDSSFMNIIMVIKK